MKPHAAGEVIKGFRIVRTLGRGGLGTTDEATREGTDERVALKRLAVAHASEWKRIELFERESRVLAQLQHPAIPRYVEHFTVDGPDGPTLYIAQELVVGQSLAELVQSGGAMAEVEVRRIAEDLLRVLDYLGRRMPPVIHRDIKPENVLRRDDGSIALVDFGAARAELKGLEGGSTTVGTYGYMAPEQLHGVAAPATDIYGLACTLLFLLTGRPPTELPRKKLQIDFEAATRGRVTPPFARWLGKALEPAAEDRFLSAASALASLRGLPGGGGPAVAFGGKTKAGVRPLTFGLLGVLVLLLAGSGARFAWTNMHSTATAPRPPELPKRWGTYQERPAITWLRWWPAHMSAVFTVSVSPAGDRIASASNDGTVKLWDMTTGEPLRSLPGHTGRVGGVTWSPDSRLVISAGDTTVLVHDAATGAQRQRLDVGAQATSVDVSPDGKRVAAGAINGTFRVWALDTGTLVFTASPGTRVLSVRFSPDGTLIATANGTEARIWAADTGAPRATLKGHTGSVGGVAWAPDGRMIATASDDRTVRLWVAEDGHQLWDSIDATDELWSVAFDRRGKYIATVGKEGVLRVDDAMSGKLLGSRELEKKGLLSVAWAPDGETVVTGDGVGRVSVQTMAVQSRADKVPPIPDTAAPKVSRTPTEVAYDRVFSVMSAGYDSRKSTDEAQGIAQNAAQADPNSPLPLLGLAVVALHRGHRSGYDYSKESLDAADDFISRALVLAPNSSEAHLQRAWIAIYRKDDVLAKDEAMTADRLRPTSSTKLLLGELAHRAHASDEAEALAMRAFGLASRDNLSRVYSLLSRIYVARGDFAAAERASERILELSPTSPWEKGNFAETLIEIQKYDAAIDMARSALKLMDYPAAHRTLAKALAEKGADALWGAKAPGLAKTAFDDALVADATYAHAHYGLGAYFRQEALRRHDAALLARSSTEFETALKLDKNLTLATIARADNDRLAPLLRVSR